MTALLVALAACALVDAIVLLPFVLMARREYRRERAARRTEMESSR